jgi:hypothetical protein
MFHMSARSPMPSTPAPKGTEGTEGTQGTEGMWHEALASSAGDDPEGSCHKSGGGS